VSTILPVLNALHSSYKTAFPTVTLYRGMPVQVPSKRDYLCVGWVPNAVAAVTGSLDEATAENVSPRPESFTITNFLRCTTGATSDAGVLADEARLFDYWDQLQVLHATNRNLGVLGSGYAAIGRFDFVPAQATAGFTAGLAFDVNVFSFV
jgi:hypothetical protein